MEEFPLHAVWPAVTRLPYFLKAKKKVIVNTKRSLFFFLRNTEIVFPYYSSSSSSSSTLPVGKLPLCPEYGLLKIRNSTSNFMLIQTLIYIGH